MRLFVLISIWLISTNSGAFVAAQSSKVTGKIVENVKESGLDFASVLLIRLPDSVTVSTQFTNEKGGYEFNDVKPGNYFITASFLGYEKGKLASFAISATDLTVPTGDFGYADHRILWRIDHLMKVFCFGVFI